MRLSLDLQLKTDLACILFSLPRFELTLYLSFSQGLYKGLGSKDLFFLLGLFINCMGT